MLWFSLVKEYWWEILLAVAGFIFVGYVGYLQSEVTSLRTDRDKLQAKIDADVIDYDRRVKEASRTTTIIETKYKTKLVYIDRWKDHNDTCSEAITALDNYQY